MNKRSVKLLAVFLSLVLLIISAIPAMADASTGVIFDFDKEKPTNSSNHKGFDISFDTQNGNSATCMKLTPQVGYGLDELSYTLTFAAGTYNSEGVVFWAKSERYSAVMSVTFLMDWRDEANVKHSATYSTQFIVTNNGREIVLPFDEFNRTAGEECNVSETAPKAFTYFIIRYHKRPDDGILSPIWLDTIRHKTDSDTATDPVYGEPDATLPTDPDSLYTPTEESPKGSVIYDCSSYPSGMTNTGFVRVLNTNPAKADAGTSFKLIPTYGYTLTQTSLTLGVPQGKTTGSGMSFWAKSDETVYIEVIFSLSSAADKTVKGDYSVQMALTPEGKRYDIPFSSLTRRSGSELNPSTAARANFYWIIIKFYKQPVSTIYFDSLKNMEYDESLEATDPIVVQTSSTARPADQEELLSHEYNWDLNTHWKLDWMDDFNGTEIDPTKWTYNYGLRNDAEWGYYTDRKENVRVENGQLIIETLKENYLNGIANYTSAEVVTRFRKTFLYGRLEIRAKLPGGKGMWPAFWTVGQSVPWPEGGEIDIIEMIGGSWPETETRRGTNLAHFTLHWAHNGIHMAHKSEGGGYYLPSGQDFSTQYHIIGMIWTPKEIKWYVDDTIYRVADITDPGIYGGFHHPHYALINTAVGSTESGWASIPDETTWATRQLYQVDYIKYYTYAGDGYNPTPGADGSTTTTSQPTGEVTTTQAAATTTVATTTQPTTVITTTAVPTQPESDPTIYEQTGLNVSGEMVSGFTQGATVDSVVAADSDVSVEFYDKNGAKVQDGVKIATGMTMKIVKDSNVTDFATVVIYGDVSGDGEINASDLLSVKRCLLSVSSLEGCYLEAGKVTKASNVSASDMLKLKLSILGIDTITQ
ncbi:MAG: family 16 glycosylhydrolase [Clostridia bacterium]|nr:family 16 glycosylhydrolase [Clostridia bacterium]